ncbi:MAG: hypothetical protein FLDDKLPJ_02772 [Phycisphaerae bacterium]|nr:hypothetical protein [Phycisphaerae bacterium]
MAPSTRGAHAAVLASEPKDIFSGEPLVYRIAPDGQDFLFYSLGPDRVDDGGKPSGNAGLGSSQGDMVFWPPEDIAQAG